MGEGHDRAGAAHFGESGRGTGMKPQRWRPVMPDDFNRGPVHATRIAGAERLHRRLFGGEAGGKGGREASFGTAVRDLALGEDATDEMIAVALDRIGNPGDFRGVETRSYNVHAFFRSYMSLPDIPDNFEWTTESWGAALRCIPLGRIAPHLFTTRQLALAWPADTAQLAAAVGARNVAMAKQVHGRTVVVVRGGSAPSAEAPEADAFVSDSTDVAVAIRVADCVPLLMADRTRGVVAAVHAGWRGTAAGAAGAALDALEREFGTRPADIVAAIGPSIGACCYEVGSDVVDAFAAAGHERHLIDRWFAAPAPPRGSRERPKLRLDVAGANRDQLVLAGVPEEQIYLSGLCTAMHLDVLTSYRAERENATRLAGVIRAGAVSV